jgi:hypothetical protein
VTRSAISHRARASVLAALVTVILAPTSAHAQLGRVLKKAAQGAVQGATQGAKEPAPNAAASVESRKEPAIPISARSLDALLTALGPSVRTLQDYEARRARYDEENGRFERHRACRDSVKKAHPVNGAAQTPAVVQAMQSYSVRYGALMQRQAAALRAGDSTRTRALTDSAGVAGEQMENVLVPALKACGAYVGVPSIARPEEPRVGAPAVPAGMTARQFGRLRERVAAWLLTNGAYDVGDDEREALEARKQDLAALTPLFRGDALVWSSWGDLK